MILILAAFLTLPTLPPLPPLPSLSTSTSTSTSFTLPEVSIPTTLPEVSLPTITITLPSIPLITIPTSIEILPTSPESSESPVTASRSDGTEASGLDTREPLHPALIVAVGGSLGALLALVALALFGRRSSLP